MELDARRAIAQKHPDWRWRFNDFCLMAPRLSGLRRHTGFIGLYDA